MDICLQSHQVCELRRYWLARLTFAGAAIVQALCDHVAIKTRKHDPTCSTG